jgi:hypothetical protein
MNDGARRQTPTPALPRKREREKRSGRYNIQPPSMTIAWPVTKALSSLAR